MSDSATNSDSSSESNYNYDTISEISSKPDPLDLEDDPFDFNESDHEGEIKVGNKWYLPESEVFKKKKRGRDI